MLDLPETTMDPIKEEPENITVSKKMARKPRLKYRPENGTILSIREFDNNTPLNQQDDHIDLEDLSFLHHALMYSKKMVVITGAGISVAAGIPDFRSSNGLFQGLKNEAGPGSGGGKQLFDMNVYRSNDLTLKFHNLMRELYRMSKQLQPTRFHSFLNELSKNNRLLRLYTQNIDCFETQLSHLETQVPIKLTSSLPKTIQLHGTIQVMYCSKCRWQAHFDPELFRTEETPYCPECKEFEQVRLVAGKRSQGVGRLRPRVVLYNEFHPDGEIIGQVSAKDLKSKPDCLIIVGTSLKIPGVRRLVKELSRTIHSSKGCIVWINTEEPTIALVDYLEYIDLIVIGDCQMIPDLMEKYQTDIANGKVKKTKGRPRIIRDGNKSDTTRTIKKEVKMIQTTLDDQAHIYKGDKIITSNGVMKTKFKKEKDDLVETRIEMSLEKLKQAMR